MVGVVGDEGDLGGAVVEIEQSCRERVRDGHVWSHALGDRDRDSVADYLADLDEGVAG